MPARSGIPPITLGRSPFLAPSAADSSAADTGSDTAPLLKDHVFPALLR
ncbi:MAG TPA: hypothetical protein H9978_02710 [Candidatus Corynebacterium faecipullorum]|nr:hypothetical protein [Candidatus Corynebacterium faecipullorum]